ncbi:Selenocysteine-specific translation elongation factor [Methanocella conradii HZ254]|uniref:Selenocysteine-specific translation elongation factor n=1 Tax=Methanocella conradii (strain DSM 24694 / JCM 17849 / CGMCC 1.5162 / HZ254) TaxID=1041930 RepID=H8I557_METCZ|nr:EF-Tu/IF-2/RF-3 family GTPase [Methanocella conradii]AFC99254.1 Selenocysteine-specific translation elongation factor [Methanocella conradii HZ254]MDI6897743.1 EF-Tu/IF-2/RF-3 family GTPase [Methanocella conradii]
MVNVALVGGERSGKTTLASRLGKKGTESDIVLYNFTKGENILTVVDPVGYPKSPKPLVNAVNMSDVVLFCVASSGLDARAGECIILMDLLRPRHGIITITKADESNPYAVEELMKKIKALTRGTAMEGWEIMPTSTKSFEGIDRLRDRLFELDELLKKEYEALVDRPVRIPIDHHFNVTGVGCVILGCVLQGTVSVHDRLTIFPPGREAEVRSIQMQDNDVKQAKAGDRVGLALKGVQSKELDRGFIISGSEAVSDALKLKCRTARFRGEFSVNDKVHLYVGLQSTPALITGMAPSANGEYEVEVKMDKEVAYSPGDKFILSRLDDPKQRFLAIGTP